AREWALTLWAQKAVAVLWSVATVSAVKSHERASLGWHESIRLDPNRRGITRGQQQYRGRNCGRRRGWYRRRPAAHGCACRLSRRGGTAAARRTRVDDARKFGISNRPRLRLAAFGRSQSLARHCRGPRLLDRQDGAAVVAASGSDRLSALGANQLSASAAKILPAASFSPRASAGRSGRGVSRAARPVECLDQCGQHVRERGGARSGLGAGCQSLRRQRRQLAGRRGLRGGDCRPWGRLAGHARPAGATDRSQRVETAGGAITADSVIVTVPSDLLAEDKPSFTPPLREKTEAAAGLPLGLADKLFLSLADAEQFDKESRLFGRTNRSDTGVYHFRPFGRPQIEAYFGGRLPAELEAGGARGI